MNLNKHLEFFNPMNIEEEVHIIGLGAIGSNLALQLARLGIDNIHLYEFDTVEEINIANQNYYKDEVGKPKLDITYQHILSINPDADITLHSRGWTPEARLSGYIFLCLDNIDTRRKIVEQAKDNKYVKAIFDFRMGLADAQHYAAETKDKKAITRLLETMDFTHEEAKKAMPISACGTSLSILPTIWTVVSAGIANFITYTKTEKYKHTILVNPFESIVDAF